MTLVAGVDSSTQSCKVVVCDLDTGETVRSGKAPHPAGTQVDPAAWETALRQAVAQAGGLWGVGGLAVAAQQHGCVCLDADGCVVRPALLWNDLGSAPDAADLVAERGREQWAADVGSVPVASFTVTKLRQLARTEPEHAARTAAVCLPHDWLTWRLRGDPDVRTLTTDRGDASGTGYWSPSTGQYRLDLVRLALGAEAVLPDVVPPEHAVGTSAGGLLLGPGTGDNAAAALGLDLHPGDVVVSLGTSGTVFAATTAPVADTTGVIAGFADAAGGFLPLLCTMNAAQVLDATARLLGVDLEGLSRLALSAPGGADGLVLVPYLEGERTPDLPLAAGSLHGITGSNLTAAHLARAAVEGMLCGLADALDVLTAATGVDGRLLLIGGAAASGAVRAVAPAVLGRPVEVVEPGEHVARGAARQAAWTLLGTASPPPWVRPRSTTVEAAPAVHVRERYADARSHVLDRARP